MALNGPGRLIVVALLAAAALSSQAVANFAASPGFSGRAGITCIACHTEAPALHTPATAILEGLPEAWDLDATYRLTIRVEGGPQAMPAPAPQGGFDLDVGAGRLQLVEGTADLLRLVGTQEVTYLPAGTLMREWQVDWVAPGLSVRPTDVPVWVAVVAANGNHVVATNVSDGGERFDATAALQVSIPPSAAATAAWKALPLAMPSANVTRTGNGDWTLEGTHRDDNATRLLWKVDGGPWQARDTAAAWRLQLTGLTGDHIVRLRSEGADRSSPELALTLHSPGLIPALDRGTPLPPLLPLLAFAFVLWCRR